MEHLKEESNRTKKIIFTGLDTAGKTSIILALQREFSKIAVISPTKGAQRRIFEFLGTEISEWDLGGQKSYRISYLKNPSTYFDNTEVAVFVIDIQNDLRIPEAISYLNDVIDRFYKLKIRPPMNVLFHKYDPNLTIDSKEKYDTLINELNKKIQKELQYEKLSFYETSIYNLSSIITAISEILLGVYPKTQLIQKIISEFSHKLNCLGLAILDHNSLIIGSYFKNNESKDIIKAIMPFFMKLDDEIQRDNNLSKDLNDHIIYQKSSYYFLFKKVILKDEFSPYYLILLKKGQYFYKDDIDPLIDLLKAVIYRKIKKRKREISDYPFSRL